MKWLISIMFLMVATVFATEAAPVVAETPVPLEGAVLALIELLRNFKGMGILALMSSVVAVIMQFLKTELLGGWLNKRAPLTKRLVVVTLGVGAGIIMQISTGATVMTALIGGLITSGGAVAIYEAVKPILKK